MPASSVPTLSAPASAEGTGVKLPRLDVPAFDGQVINWNSFWEQFDISIHRQTNLSNTEKLVYLKQSFKDGTAKGVIEGLSKSGEHYKEAIKSLKARYDRPRLIHQTHTHARMILEAASLKEGTSKELRRLHDTMQQHFRALRAMDYEPSGPFITSVLELKLDTNTMFEWHKFSPKVPHYQDLLEFLNLRAQASESSLTTTKKGATVDHRQKISPKQILSFAASTSANSENTCILCKTEKHPLFACSQFKAMSHDKKISTLKSQDICLNCLQPGHSVRQCKSLHRCRRCQNPHHTLLHVERREQNTLPAAPTQTLLTNVSSNVTTPGLLSHSLFMTCRILVRAPDRSSIVSCALLDPGSSASFVSERLTQSLRLPRLNHGVRIMGIGGLSHESPTRTLTKFVVSPTQEQKTEIDVTAVIMTRVTCDLPLQPIPFKHEWTHLSDLTLADPDFGEPGWIDILLGIDVYTQIICQGRRTGVPGSPSAFGTVFGWVLAGEANTCTSNVSVISYHASSVISGDQILQCFWEIEEPTSNPSGLSPEERMVIQHFQGNHQHTESGRFLVPLLKKPHCKPVGESRSQAVRRYFFPERSLQSKNQFGEFSSVMKEYFEQGHAEQVPTPDLDKPTNQVFYLPMHSIRKETSNTTKVRAVLMHLQPHQVESLSTAY